MKPEPIVKFNKATNRSTESYWIRVASVALLVSYETIVAASTYANTGRIRIKQKNHWGPTTGRHMREALLDVSDSYIVVEDPTEFVERVNDMIYQSLAQQVATRMHRTYEMEAA